MLEVFQPMEAVHNVCKRNTCLVKTNAQKAKPEKKMGKPYC